MTAPSHPNDARPQGQAAYLRIIDDIARGVLEPGARLREVEIATRLGLSRTPVREALRLLEADGLVTHMPRLGAVLRRIDYAEVSELYDMRAALESSAARMAAHRATPADLQQLAALNHEFGLASDPASAATINRQFHSLLHHVAGNRFLLKSMRGLQKTMLLLGPSTLARPDRTRAAHAEHAALLAALHERDADRAESLMRHHLAAAYSARLQDPRYLTDNLDSLIDN